LNNDNKENNAYEDRNSIVKEEWTTSQQTHDRREKIQALSLAKDCYAMKLDLLTNATVVDDAIRFVTSIPNNNTHGEAVKPKADVCIPSYYGRPPVTTFIFVMDSAMRSIYFSEKLMFEVISDSHLHPTSVN